jgi:hypothetical protein
LTCRLPSAILVLKGEAMPNDELNIKQQLDNAVADRNRLMERLKTLSVYETILVTPLLQAAQLKVERLSVKVIRADQAK